MNGKLKMLQFGLKSVAIDQRYSSRMAWLNDGHAAHIVYGVPGKNPVFTPDASIFIRVSSGV